MPSDFVPKRHRVTDISNDQYAIVTTQLPNGYELGQVVRLVVPNAYGMSLPYVQAKILALLSNTRFETDIDTRNQLPFVEPTFPPAYTEAQVVPISGVENNIAGDR
jgi:hypothetical protein